MQVFLPIYNALYTLIKVAEEYLKTNGELTDSLTK